MFSFSLVVVLQLLAEDNSKAIRQVIIASFVTTRNDRNSLLDFCSSFPNGFLEVKQKES